MRYESLNPKVRWFLRSVDVLAYFPFGLWKRLRKPQVDRNTRMDRILLVRCDGIGDLICSIPAIAALRCAYPKAVIDIVVSPWCADIAACIPYLDEVLVYDSWAYNALRQEGNKTFGLGDEISFARAIRMRSYDLKVDLRGDLLTILPMFFWGPGKLVARATRGGGPLLDRVIPPAAANRRHESEKTLDLIGSILGKTIAGFPGDLQIPETSLQSTREMFSNYNLNPEKTILFAPGAQWKWRQWPTEHFQALAEKLIGRGMQVAISGSKAQRASLQAICPKPYSADVVNLCGRLSLTEFAAACGLCKAIVAVDSGPAHIARAMNARGVVLFGPADVERFGPHNSRLQMIRKECPLNPCQQINDCQRQEDWCMKRISVDEVFAALMNWG